MSKRLPATSLRARSKERTREALVDAATNCFSEQGLEAPSLDVICERAGCTRGAFYVHFTDRDELIVAAMERRRGNVLDRFLGSSEEGVHELLESIAGAIESKLLPVPGAVRTGELVTAARRSSSIRATQNRLTRDTLARLSERIRADQTRGRVRRDLDAGTLALVLLLVETGAELWLDLGVSFDARRVAEALGVLLTGAGRPSRSRRLRAQ
jgi:TetR/AcrR family transcriptional regulator, transcriptional repressor for nem operon